jgi:HEAT repeat protein
MKPLFLALLLIAGTAFAQEDKLIAVLKSDAPPREKADACRELARVGSKLSVPALAALLPDEKLSQMARSALEPIPDPSVDAALRGALGKLKGRLLVGVISSLGVRKDTAAIKPLATLLTETDPTVAQAAARALGSIGGPAARALERGLSTVSPTNQLAVCEGLFRCAEAMSDADATTIYDQVRALPNLPHHVRAAALRGAIRRRGAKGLPLLVEAIRTESYVPAADAIRISVDMPGPEVTQALVRELAQASQEKRLLILQALGCRGDDAAAPALVALSRSGSTNQRVAAIRSLGLLVTPSSIPMLAGLVEDPEATVSSAALAGLIGFPGHQADAAVMMLLSESDDRIRVAAIEAVSQRRMTTAAPLLLKAAGDANAGVANASFKVLGELAGVAEIPGLIDLLLQAKDVAPAETALSAICARQPDTGSCAGPLLPGLAKAQGEPKLAMLRVLGTAGGPGALTAVRAAALDSDASVKATALRALCEWPSAEALPDLGRISATNSDPRFKLLALRGQLRLIPMQVEPDAAKLSQLKEILPLLEHPEEQRLALVILGDLPSPESLALLTPYLSSTGLKEEASVAAVAVADKIVAGHPAEVAAAMKIVQTNGSQLAKRAGELLARVPLGTK